MFAMLWVCVFLYSHIISASPASLPGSGTQLSPSNISLPTSSGGNTVLGAWPSIPWKTYIPRTDLVLDFKAYGRYADQSKWPAIRKDLDELQAWFDAEKNIPEEALDFQIFQRDTFTLRLSRMVRSPGIIGISASEASQVVQVINGFFFAFNDKPREFNTQIYRREQPYVRLELAVFWFPEPSNWPVKLPWPLLSAPGADMMVELYGSEMDPKGALTHQIDRDLNYFKNDFLDEGPQEGPINHSVYRHRYLRLEILQLDPEVAVERRMMQVLLTAIKNTYFHVSPGKVTINCGPRELGVYLYGPGKGNFAKVLITYNFNLGDDVQNQNVTET